MQNEGFSHGVKTKGSGQAYIFHKNNHSVKSVGLTLMVCKSIATIEERLRFRLEAEKHKPFNYSAIFDLRFLSIL